MSTNYSVQKAESSKFCMFWPIEMKQLQNISVDVNVMLPNTDFARLELGPVTPLFLTKYYIIITNTKPEAERFPDMINLPRFTTVLLGPSGKFVIIIIIYDHRLNFFRTPG